MTTTAHASLDTNEPERAISGQNVLDAMASGKGYEAYDLARRLSIPTAQLKALLVPLIADDKVEARRDREDLSGYRRLHYYRCASPTGPKPATTAPLTRASRDISAQQLLAAMVPGIGYSPTEIGLKLGISTQRVMALIQPFVYGHKVVSQSRLCGSISRNLYYLVGTEPLAPNTAQATTTPCPAASVFARSTYDAEYGRTLMAHRIFGGSGVEPRSRHPRRSRGVNCAAGEGKRQLSCP
ncbi:MAG: hypothetical protein VB131_08145 [Burkholderia gladioli]